MTTATWTRAQVAAMIRYPQGVAKKILGRDPQPATVSLVRALGITCLRAPGGSTVGFRALRGRLHVYDTPASQEAPAAPEGKP